MKVATLLAPLAIACSVQISSAALSVMPSSSFASQYSGDDIFDGTTTINGWVAEGGATDANLALSGSNLVMSLTDTNGWVQHDNGSTPWENGSGSWTVETRVMVSSNAGAGGIVVWGALNGERNIMTVRENSVTDLGGTVFSVENNVGGFHNFRLAFDADASAYHYFRDGVQITPAAGIAAQAGTGSTRLILGDCCTGIAGSTFGGPDTTFEIEYIRYDNGGSFAPVPEPSSVALFGLASLGLLLRRRR